MNLNDTLLNLARTAGRVQHANQATEYGPVVAAQIGTPVVVTLTDEKARAEYGIESLNLVRIGYDEDNHVVVLEVEQPLRFKRMPRLYSRGFWRGYWVGGIAFTVGGALVTAIVGHFA